LLPFTLNIALLKNGWEKREKGSTFMEVKEIVKATFW
jgi:hypothetical protein